MFELREIFQNNIEKLDWYYLSSNQNAIHLLKKIQIRFIGTIYH